VPYAYLVEKTLLPCFSQRTAGFISGSRCGLCRWRCSSPSLPVNECLPLRIRDLSKASGEPAGRSLGGRPSEKDHFLERRRRTDHREPSLRGGGTALYGTISFAMRSEPLRSLWLGMSRWGSDPRRAPQPDRRLSASQAGTPCTRARLDSAGATRTGPLLVCFNATKIATSRKTSGRVDEITGIANHAIMQSRLRKRWEHSRNRRSLSASCTSGGRALTFFARTLERKLLLHASHGGAHAQTARACAAEHANRL
jgi:hypothetical protein